MGRKYLVWHLQPETAVFKEGVARIPASVLLLMRFDAILNTRAK